MSWKSTIEISRREAKRLIMQKFNMLDDLTNRELEDMIEELGYGEEPGLDYYGHNFIVTDTGLEGD